MFLRHQNQIYRGKVYIWRWRNNRSLKESETSQNTINNETLAQYTSQGDVWIDEDFERFFFPLWEMVCFASFTAIELWNNEKDVHSNSIHFSEHAFFPLQISIVVFAVYGSRKKYNFCMIASKSQQKLNDKEEQMHFSFQLFASKASFRFLKAFFKVKYFLRVFWLVTSLSRTMKGKFTSLAPERLNKYFVHSSRGILLASLLTHFFWQRSRKNLKSHQS